MKRKFDFSRPAWLPTLPEFMLVVMIVIGMIVLFVLSREEYRRNIAKTRSAFVRGHDTTIFLKE